MRFNYRIVAVVIGSFALGLGVASVLHAQTKPPAYVFAEIDVKDQDGYAKDVLPKAQANVKEFGGKYLAGGFNKAISLNGAPPANRVALLEFPNVDALQAFAAKQKQLEADIGNQYANFRGIGIEGVERK
jgi:uncharacterized protein (DUF1330 family)